MFIEKTRIFMNRLQKSLSVMVFLAASFFLVLLCSAAKYEVAQPPSIKAAFASVQREGKPYKAFYNNYIAPHAVLEKDTVFTTHQDGEGRPLVSAYNIKKKTWTGPVMASKSGLGADQHGNPSICIDGNGYLHIFFGSHGGPMKHVRSAAPYDLRRWEDMPSPTRRATYPQSMRMADNSIYLFYRAGGHLEPWSLRISKDNGRTWSAPQPIIEMRRNFPDQKAASYNAFVPGADYRTVHCFWVYKDDNPRGNKRKYQGLREGVYRYNLYYSKRTAEGKWLAADGTGISNLPINKRFSDEHAMVFDSVEEFTKPTRIVIDQDDTPYIRFKHGVRDVKPNKVIVPYQDKFASLEYGKWQVHEDMSNQWPELVKCLLISPGPAAFGGLQPNQWFIHYKNGPSEDPNRTYVWLGHIEMSYAYAIRQDGSPKSVQYPFPLLPPKSTSSPHR